MSRARRALEELRARQQARRRRRRIALLVVLALLLLLLIRLCSCAEEPPPPPAPEPVGASEPATSAEVQAVEPLAGGRVDRRDRPALANEVPDALPWLAAFRMQVAARSRSLASCFVGVSRPGRLKWSALVEPSTGLVSEPTLEPILESDSLTREQRACVLGALADPPYRLEGDERATPSRVSLVIEF
jgi:hypothetical protein